MRQHTNTASLVPLSLSPSEERVAALTHGVGFLLSVAGLLVLMAAVLPTRDIWRIAGCGLYGITLIAVYAASTLSHSFSKVRLRHFFRVLDQAVIYLLIVGTYTPFAVTYLRIGSWWILLAVMWTIALVGFASKLLFAHRVNAVSIWIYILLGWMPIVTITTLLPLVPHVALWMMLGGGICYSLGTLFLMNDHRLIHLHAAWHLFVIAGSMLHYFAILFFVARG